MIHLPRPRIRSRQVASHTSSRRAASSLSLPLPLPLPSVAPSEVLAPRHHPTTIRIASHNNAAGDAIRWLGRQHNQHQRHFHSQSHSPLPLAVRRRCPASSAMATSHNNSSNNNNNNRRWNFHSHRQPRRLLSDTPKRSPYVVLGLTGTKGIVTKNDVRTAFCRLAKAYHPDLNRSSSSNSNNSSNNSSNSSSESGSSNSNSSDSSSESDHGRTKEECEALMAELLEAYEILRSSDDGDDFAARFRVGHPNIVALACDLYSLDELRMDRFHDVYDLVMDFSPAGEETTSGNSNSNSNSNTIDSSNGSSNSNIGSSNSNIGNSNTIGSSNDTASPTSARCDGNGTNNKSSNNDVLVPPRVYHNNSNSKRVVRAHPEDSVSDLKRQLEANHGAAWGLGAERPHDRDGLSVGWELVVLRGGGGDCGGDSGSKHPPTHPSNGIGLDSDGDTTVAPPTSEVLSYHLFLDDYGIRHGETVYAVVRKHNAP